MAYDSLNVGASISLGTVSCGNNAVERAVCLFCSERFEVSVLSNHVRSHFVFPVEYNCDVCGFKSSSRGDMVSHSYESGHKVF